MKFKVGDCVRIKAPNELKNVKVHGGSAIDKWQNKICEVTEVKQTINGGRYRLTFCERLTSRQEYFAAGTHISNYFWEEFELDYVESNSIEEQAYEELLGGVQ